MCGSSVTKRTELPLVTYSHNIELYPNTLINKLISCSDSTIVVKSVRYGLRNATICPKPSSLIIPANMDYCNSVKNFFVNLIKK